MSSTDVKVIVQVSEAPFPDTLAGELEEIGISVVPAKDRKQADGACGFLIARESDTGRLSTSLAEWDRPGLLLVYGDRVAGTAAEALAARHPGWEVVRLYRFAGGERALVGGNLRSPWTRIISRQLAKHDVVAMVCGMREAEEVIRQLPRYLAWKERFYLRLGESCDRRGVRLQTVARALGMDSRIGQGWLDPQRMERAALRRWLVRQCRFVMRKTNVRRVALWGPPSLWKQMPPGWMADKEVRLYVPRDEQIPNGKGTLGERCTTWQTALAEADLLVVASPDPELMELPLSELIRHMRQPIVVDACGCFPLPEAEALQMIYRTIGEKTNVWEWSGL
ncbi:hypothetical protein [Brevibacillus sedimenti]|uniref:hypothetical protein n=1 Tax=Brevibacillus sedimenti TaxID=2613334 RepID=UPI001E308F5B|nr:hypothetical protein [Anoxybacillus sediminis]UFJ62268.1 hypothetical protein IRT44_05535 [Anoxybacillus sediminis]